MSISDHMSSYHFERSGMRMDSVPIQSNVIGITIQGLCSNILLHRPVLFVLCDMILLLLVSVDVMLERRCQITEYTVYILKCFNMFLYLQENHGKSHLVCTRFYKLSFARELRITLTFPWID